MAEMSDTKQQKKNKDKSHKKHHSELDRDALQKAKKKADKNKKKREDINESSKGVSFQDDTKDTGKVSSTAQENNAESKKDKTKKHKHKHKRSEKDVTSSLKISKNESSKEPEAAAASEEPRKEDTEERTNTENEQQKEAAEEELADIEAAEKTHEIRSKNQKYRTLSRKKSSEEKWGRKSISSKSVRQIQIERKVVWDVFTPPPAKEGGVAAAPSAPENIKSEDKNAAVSNATVDTSTTQETHPTTIKKHLPRRTAGKPKTKFDMIKKFKERQGVANSGEFEDVIKAEEIKVDESSSPAPKRFSVSSTERPIETKTEKRRSKELSATEASMTPTEMRVEKQKSTEVTSAISTPSTSTTSSETKVDIVASKEVPSLPPTASVKLEVVQEEAPVVVLSLLPPTVETKVSDNKKTSEMTPLGLTVVETTTVVSTTAKKRGSLSSTSSAPSPVSSTTTASPSPSDSSTAALSSISMAVAPPSSASSSVTSATTTSPPPPPSDSSTVERSSYPSAVPLSSSPAPKSSVVSTPSEPFNAIDAFLEAAKQRREREQQERERQKELERQQRLERQAAIYKDREFQQENKERQLQAYRASQTSAEGLSPANSPNVAPKSTGGVTPSARAFGRSFNKQLDDEETAAMYRAAIHKAKEYVHRKRLIQCKGRKRAWVREVEVSYKSLNEGDAFVLDCNDIIYVWHGPKANQIEKAKASAVGIIIRDHERSRHATVVTIDKNTTGPDVDKFWEQLGGKGPIAPADEGGNDEEFEKQQTETLKLYHVEMNENGIPKPVIVIQPEKKLLMDMLIDTETYVLDCGNEVYAWYGRECGEEARHALKDAAKEVYKSIPRPEWVPLIMVGQGGEPLLFRERFADWPDLSHQSAIKKMYKQHESLNKKRVVETTFNPETMLYDHRVEEEIESPDGDGELKIWVIKDKTKVQIAEEEFGHFYSGNCYIIVYEYKKRNALRYIIWTWQGKTSSKLEQGYAVKFTEEVYRHYSRTVFIIQQMVFQNKEPLQFLLVFKGQYIIHKGTRDDVPDKCVMYHIRGTDYLPLHAIQCNSPSASRLNSRDSFVVRNANTQIQYVWYGKGSSDVEKVTQTDELATMLCDWDDRKGIKVKLIVKCLEGEEPADFWETLGGKKEYANAPYLEKFAGTKIKLRLFHCTAAKHANAVFSANEVHDFYQEDLNPRDIMILDTFFEVYVWIGSKSTEMARKQAMEIANTYIKLVKEREKREHEIQTYVVYQGNEPLMFKAFFHAWEDQLKLEGEDLKIKGEARKEQKSAESMAASAGPSSSPATPSSPPQIQKVDEALRVFYQKYPYEVLKTNPPKECDKGQLEAYLTDEEFEKVFKMTRQKYYEQPKWKQLRQKKEVGLF